MRDVLLAFRPGSWRWAVLAAPPLSPREGADVTWTGKALIVFGGHGTSGILTDGSSYSPRTNRWTVLPPVPAFPAAEGTTASPVGATAAWAGTSFFVWITRQEIQVQDGTETASAVTQALRWRPGAPVWERAPPPPPQVLVFGATAVTAGDRILLADGTACLPDETCPYAPGGGRMGRVGVFHSSMGTWSTLAAESDLTRAGSVSWTGSSLVAVSPYETSKGYVLGGYAAAIALDHRAWTSLPQLPVPRAQPTGVTFSGSVWAGTELIDAGLVLKPGRIRTGQAQQRTAGNGSSPPPICPSISFPDFVNGTFCGPAPGPGNGNGPTGSCSGTETLPPCGPGMEPGKYYAYTVLGACPDAFVDGRWWASELPGGYGPVDVWMSVEPGEAGAGWIGPSGAVGFRLSSGVPCPSS